MRGCSGRATAAVVAGVTVGLVGWGCGMAPGGRGGGAAVGGGGESAVASSGSGSWPRNFFHQFLTPLTFLLSSPNTCCPCFLRFVSLVTPFSPGKYRLAIFACWVTCRPVRCNCRAWLVYFPIKGSLSSHAEGLMSFRKSQRTSAYITKTISPKTNKASKQLSRYPQNPSSWNCRHWDWKGFEGLEQPASPLLRSRMSQPKRRCEEEGMGVFPTNGCGA